jgi:hypothetical protein
VTSHSLATGVYFDSGSSFVFSTTSFRPMDAVVPLFGVKRPKRDADPHTCTMP